MLSIQVVKVPLEDNMQMDLMFCQYGLVGLKGFALLDTLQNLSFCISFTQDVDQGLFKYHEVHTCEVNPTNPRLPTALLPSAKVLVITLSSFIPVMVAAPREETDPSAFRSFLVVKSKASLNSERRPTFPKLRVIMGRLKMKRQEYRPNILPKDAAAFIKQTIKIKLGNIALGFHRKAFTVTNFIICLMFSYS